MHGSTSWYELIKVHIAINTCGAKRNITNVPLMKALEH